MSIDELKSKLGTELESVTCEIERGMIRSFVQAIDDSNPLWQNEEYARKSQHDGIVAPPTFILAIGFEQFLEQILALASFGTILHGSTEFECYQPIRPGDVVAVTTKITNVRERDGKMGKTAFITFEITYRNQRQELVAKCRQMVIGY